MNRVPSFESEQKLKRTFSIDSLASGRSIDSRRMDRGSSPFVPPRNMSEISSSNTKGSAGDGNTWVALIALGDKIEQLKAERACTNVFNKMIKVRDSASLFAVVDGDFDGTQNDGSEYGEGIVDGQEGRRGPHGKRGAGGAKESKSDRPSSGRGKTERDRSASSVPSPSTSTPPSNRKKKQKQKKKRRESRKGKIHVVILDSELTGEISVTEALQYIRKSNLAADSFVYVIAPAQSAASVSLPSSTVDGSDDDTCIYNLIRPFESVDVLFKPLVSIILLFSWKGCLRATFTPYLLRIRAVCFLSGLFVESIPLAPLCTWD